MPFCAKCVCVALLYSKLMSLVVWKLIANKCCTMCSLHGKTRQLQPFLTRTLPMEGLCLGTIPAEGAACAQAGQAKVGSTPVSMVYCCHIHFSTSKAASFEDRSTQLLEQFASLK